MVEYPVCHISPHQFAAGKLNPVKAAACKVYIREVAVFENYIAELGFPYAARSKAAVGKNTGLYRKIILPQPFYPQAFE